MSSKTMKEFIPDYNQIIKAARNEKPDRLPIYEHLIAPEIMEKIKGRKFAHLQNSNPDDIRAFYKEYCAFFRDMGYDTVSMEVVITSVVNQAKSLMGAPGIIRSRADLEEFNIKKKIKEFFLKAGIEYECLGREMPDGMKGIGGVGNGIFEVAQDFVCYTDLCLLKTDDPELFSEIFKKSGELVYQIWEKFLKDYGKFFAVCRIGDDLGFRTSTFFSPDDIMTHIIPQYIKIVELIHSYDKPFLFHSCGCIFKVMDDFIDQVKIDAKHSNEDQIAPFSKWVEEYGDRIGNFGGVDMNILCLETEENIKKYVLNVIEESIDHQGFAVGSGNSIPDYVPVKGYLAMIEAVREYRGC